VGIADKVPPGVRPVRQSSPGTADAGSAVRRSPTASPGDIDFWVVRETPKVNTHPSAGGCSRISEREFVTQQTVMTRIGVDRILKFAFELAHRGRRSI